MWETRTEEGSVNCDRSKLGNVNLVAPWAENFESGNLQAVAESDWEHLLSITESPWAGAIKTREELVVNFCHPARRVDKASMDKTVEVTSLLV